MEKDSVVGRRLPRRDVTEKILGSAEYLDDIALPGMLHGALLASPYAHARIIRIDSSAARALPGVRAVLTGLDLPHRHGCMVKDETVLAQDVVRYVGEPVAAVAADTEDIAREALRLIEVEYEELQPVLSIAEAMAPGAPLIHDNLDGYIKVFPAKFEGNVLSDQEIREGDIDSAWSGCEVIVESTFRTQAQCHAYMEPCGAIAQMAGDGKLTVWSSTQSIFRLQASLSESLGIPMSKIRAISPRIGGGFGGKMEATVQPITAALAIRTRRPVKVVLTRSEDFQMMRSRHPSEIRLRTGARRDGTLVAREVDILLDGGAYSDDSPAVLGLAVLMARGPYAIPNIRVRGRVMYTNKLRAAGFRGFGNPQITFASECQLDELAEKLQMNPAELRLRNALQAGDRFFGGQPVSSCALKDCIEQVLKASDWANRRERKQENRALGISCVIHPTGMLSSSAIVRLLEDGSITLSTGAVDIGTGSETAFAQICAQTLGIDVSLVNVTQPDTDASPYNWGTAGSRSTHMVGRAVVGAADSVRKQIFRHASDMLECPESDLELRSGGKVGVVGMRDRAIGFGDISLRAHWMVGGPIIGTESVMFDGAAFDATRSAMTGFPFANIGTYVFGAQVADVEVDRDTGAITVHEFWAAHDVGKAINPTGVEGQIQGGVVQGLGYALLEEMIWDDARLANPSLMDYKIPAALDVPAKIHAIIVEDPDPAGPFGAKGIGEPGLIGVAPAVANAIAAGTEVRLRELPMTDERFFRAAMESGR